MKHYCITMELTCRIAMDIAAASDSDAILETEETYDKLASDKHAFDNGDMETSYALSEAGANRNLTDWTKPVSIEHPNRPERPAPAISDPDDHDPDAYVMTVEKTLLASEWFDAKDDEAAMAKAENVMQEYNADPDKFLSGEPSYDYALSDPDGRDIVPWN